MAHRVISLPHGNSVAFGLKRTLGRILRVDGLVSRPPPRQAAAAGANVQRLRSFGVACWTWIYCEKCLGLPIRRVTDCGSAAAALSAATGEQSLQHPGWAGTHIGFQPFPLPASGS